jgi:hypothetical protein
MDVDVPLLQTGECLLLRRKLHHRYNAAESEIIFLEIKSPLAMGRVKLSIATEKVLSLLIRSYTFFLCLLICITTKKPQIKILGAKLILYFLLNVSFLSLLLVFLMEGTLMVTCSCVAPLQ